MSWEENAVAFPEALVLEGNCGVGAVGVLWKFEPARDERHGDAGIQLPAQLSGIGHSTARAGPGR